MINRIFSGSGGRGILSYVLHDKNASSSERCTTIYSTFCSDDIQGMTKELRELYSARRARGKDIPSGPMRHFVLSLPDDDELSEAQWQRVAFMFMCEMGYEGQPHLVVRHSDTGKDHCHIVTSRIKPNGLLVSDSMERQKALKATQKIEQAFGLKEVMQTPKPQLSKPDGFDVQKFITVARLTEMRKAKQYPLANLCKATGADFSCLAPELIFCMNRKGRTLAKLRDNTQVIFQDGKVTIKAPSAGRRREVQRLIGSVIYTKAELGEHAAQQAFIEQKRQQLRAKKSGLANEQRKQVSRGASPAPQTLERNTANAWALSATPEQRETHRKATTAFAEFQTAFATAKATGSSQAPALAVAASNVGATTGQIDALNLLIAQTTDPIERGRLIGQVVALEQRRAAQLRDEMDAINDAWQREEQRKTDEAKASNRRRPGF